MIIKKNKLSVSIAMKLLSMMDGNAIASSSFPSWLYDDLSEEGVISSISNKSKISYRFTDIKAAIRYIQDKYIGGLALKEWIDLNNNGNIERSTLVQKMNNSKAVKVRSFKGFLVNCYEPINIKLGNKRSILSPIEDSAVFIQNPDEFIIPKDIVVVGVENAENFRFIRRQKYLFTDYKVLFASRYPQEQSIDFRNWLMSISNKYIHFGDFDLAGINIYLKEYYKFLGDRSSFFIPQDIENKIKNGNTELYDLQYLKYSNMKITDNRVIDLVNMINSYHRVYEQEGYIK